MQLLDSDNQIFERRRVVLDQAIAHFKLSKCFPYDLPFKTFENFNVSPENKTGFDQIGAWANDEFGFLIMGPSGSGKSHLAFALLNKILDHVSEMYEGRISELIAFYNTSEFLETLRRDMESGSKFESAKEVDYLFLDDLGVENLTDWGRDHFYRLFEYRLNRRKATFITTNLSLDELKERLHERILSRLKEMCVFVQLKGNDKRTDRMKENMKLLNERIKERDQKS